MATEPDTPLRYYRKVFRITAEDSPNVRYARAQIKVGKTPDNTIIVPGVMPWGEMQKRRATWDKISQCIGLDANFYEGAEVLMYPPLWLNRSNELARYYSSSGVIRKALGIGIDPAEGGDKTAMAAVDRLGVIELVSKKTPNTAVVVNEAIAFMLKHGVPADRVCIDRGGGGKQHADQMRERGYPIRTVAFGEPVVPPLKRGLTRLDEKVESREERYAYYNRRAQLWGELRVLMDPEDTSYIDDINSPLYEIHVANNNNNRKKNTFSIDLEKYPEVRKQLSPIPLTYDPEGRLKLLPKNKRAADSEEMTLTQLIGHSPDETDAITLAIHAMLHKSNKAVAGAAR